MPVPAPNTFQPGAVAFGGRPAREAHERLSNALHEWWGREQADWDARIEDNGAEAVSDAAGSDLWESMPMIDSKAVARTSPIFEEHMGRPLDISLIRPGGYDSVTNMIRHLVPAMMDVSRTWGGIRAVKQEVES